MRALTRRRSPASGRTRRHLLDMLDDATSSTSPITFVTGASSCELTLGDLWRRSERAAAGLRGRVERGGAVAMVLEATPDCLAALFGGWRAGLTVASLPHPTRGTSAEAYASQLEAICASLGADLLLAGHELADAIAGPGHIRVLPFEQCLAGAVRGVAADQVGRFVQFTGGTTAAPKGVELSLTSIAENVRSILDRVGVRDSDTACSWLPLSHDMGLVGMCLAPIASFGGSWRMRRVVLFAPREFLANPSRWFRVCDAFDATLTCAPNFALDLSARRLARATALDLSRLRVLIVGSELVQAGTLRRFSDAAGRFGFEARALCPAYGLAEATLAVTLVDPDETWRSVAVDRAALGDARLAPSTGDGIEIVSTGRAIPGVAVRIAPGDGDDVGRIDVDSPALFDRYVGGQPRAPEGPWWPTADLGMIDDGELFPVGRMDDILVVAGRAVYATDVEAIAAGDAGVRAGNCAAVASDDGSYHLVVEAATGVRPARDRRQAHDVASRLRAEIGRQVGASPRAVHFIRRGTILRTPSGKLRRNDMVNRLRTGGLEVERTITFGPRHGTLAADR
jgi:acyl-CoA synthetase (AMP-forming)/AMP-acid ligase II